MSNQCRQCAFFQKSGVCHRYPPNVIFLPLVNPTVVGAKPTVSWQVNSAYPPVDAGQEACGEFTPPPEVVN